MTRKEKRGSPGAHASVRAEREGANHCAECRVKIEQRSYADFSSDVARTDACAPGDEEFVVPIEQFSKHYF